VLSYTVQLYFDFSGYSDMAIGLARMFSIRFPMNFDSPYKADNIIDFWSKWHMTLTRYVTLYLYNPMSLWVNRRRLAKGKKVSRKGVATLGGFTSMVAFPTMVAMLLIGVWHGAGFQFLLFGLFHGVYLTVNHAWRILRGKRPEPESVWTRRMQYAGSVFLTMLCVIVGQVLFRADSTAGAFTMLHSMLGAHGWRMRMDHPALAEVARLLPRVGIIYLLPNTQQILARFESAEGVKPPTGWLGRWFVWRPSLGWAFVIAVAFLASLTWMVNTSRFLYFQF
jgi:alginate O-acetyltransferase complex protein AlgI